jgi:pimeloyl-ACP methyl ester carboxylesterase
MPNLSDPPKPAKVTTVGTLRVERYGNGSPAMIFVPGLTCGSWVWDDAVRAYSAKHAVYVVTLDGFDGLPPAPGPGSALDAADASLLQLISTEKLDRPIVIGHSLGGFLALRFGTEHANLVRGIVAVDGLPVFPTLAQATVAARTAAADGMQAQLAGATPAQFAAGQKASIDAMVTDPGDAAAVLTLAEKSDPKATAEYMGELLRSDLRPDLAKLTVPTLEIAPVPTKPAAYEGPQAATASMADRESGYKAFYMSLFPGAPNVTIVPIANSRHFVMLDQPAALYAAIDAFVATLPGATS